MSCKHSAQSFYIETATGRRGCSDCDKERVGAKYLTRLQSYLLRKVARVLVIQGPFHRARIIAYYRVLIEAAREEFREDNKMTLDDFLQECHEAALGTLKKVTSTDFVEEVDYIGAGGRP